MSPAHDIAEVAARCHREGALAQADAHNNLGVALAVLGSADGAFACYQQALRCDPEHYGALTNIGNSSQEQGRSAEAIASFRQALAVRPDEAKVHSNLMLALQYRTVNDTREPLDEARAYAARRAGPWVTTAPHGVRPLAGRRLRVGYVSADLCEHPVARFFEPVQRQPR